MHKREIIRMVMTLELVKQVFRHQVHILLKAELGYFIWLHMGALNIPWIILNLITWRHTDSSPKSHSFQNGRLWQLLAPKLSNRPAALSAKHNLEVKTGAGISLSDACAYAYAQMFKWFLLYDPLKPSYTWRLLGSLNLQATTLGPWSLWTFLSSLILQSLPVLISWVRFLVLVFEVGYS